MAKGSAELAALLARPRSPGPLALPGHLVPLRLSRDPVRPPVQRVLSAPDPRRPPGRVAPVGAAQRGAGAPAGPRGAAGPCTGRAAPGLLLAPPAPSYASNSAGGTSQISAASLITRWIVPAGKLDIWRVPADRAPVNRNRPGLARGDSPTPGPAVIRTREPRRPVHISGPCRYSSRPGILVLADLGGQFFRRGRAEDDRRAGLAQPGVQDAADADPAFPPAWQLAKQRRERAGLRR